MGFQAGDENIKRYVGNSTTIAIDPTGLDFLDNYANWFNSQVGTGYSTTVGAGLHTVFNQVGVSDQTLANADPFVLTAGTIVASTAIVLGGEILLGVGTIGQATLSAGVALADSAYALGAMRLTWAVPRLFGQGGFGLGIGGTLSATGTASAWVTGTIPLNAWWIIAPTVLAMNGAHSWEAWEIHAELDGTGKLHGTLPDKNNLQNYDIEELARLAKELPKSIQKRIEITVKTGADHGHNDRIAKEVDLVVAILKFLGL